MEEYDQTPLKKRKKKILKVVIYLLCLYNTNVIIIMINNDFTLAYMIFDRVEEDLIQTS